ncbi:hypothetical protein D9615_003032 [Tricholomella constricta]|uniref:3'-5' exonuclease n=1 Tax=Tricholomella constricta TaxID=117010 RepID=A0A8H5M638_9AGAR|nr:hypothetical protein D9615_003032 [Tricholomella constricta]
MSQPSNHGGARAGSGRKPKLSNINSRLFTSNNVAGKPGRASTFFAKHTNVDSDSLDGPISRQDTDPNFLTPHAYTRLQSEWSDMQELEPEEGRGDAEVEESVFEKDDDDLLNAMNRAEQESEEENKLLGVHADYLRGVVEKLKAEIKSSGKPACYQKGTFWIRPRDPLFALHTTKNSETGYSPTELYHLPIFVWLPEWLPGRPDYLRCSRCPGKHHLVRNGWNSNPIARRVRDMHNDYFLMTGRFVCNKDAVGDPGCGASYQGTDPEILAQLPRDVQESFPAYLTARGAIDKNLMSVMRTLFANRFGPEPFASLLGEMRHLHHAHRELMYLAACVSSPTQPPPVPFSEFNDKNRYAGTHPSTEYCKSIFVDWMRAHRVFYDRVMASLPGAILKGDHTFKLIKYMARLSGEPTHDAMYTVVNEWEDARNQAFTLTKSLSYVSEMYQDIADGIKEHGHPPTSFMYTDNASGELGFHESTTKSLTNNVKHRELDPYSSLPALTIPEGLRVAFYDSPDLIDSACLAILDSIPDDGSHLVIGFDIEYQVETTGQGGPGAVPRAQTSQLDVIQIAMEDTVYIFKVTQFKTPSSVPPCLRSVLVSDQIIKTGRAVRADLLRIAEAWSISELVVSLQKSDTSSMELGTLAKLKGKISDASAGLAALCGIVLQKHLSKPDSLRFSQWSSAKLSDSQKNYAALDAYACWLIWKRLSTLPSTGLHVEENVPGQLIRASRTLNVTPSRTVILVEEVVVPVSRSSLRTRSAQPPVSAEKDLPTLHFVLPKPFSTSAENNTPTPGSEHNDDFNIDLEGVDSEDESESSSDEWDEGNLPGFQTFELNTVARASLSDPSISDDEYGDDDFDTFLKNADLTSLTALDPPPDLDVPPLQSPRATENPPNLLHQPETVSGPLSSRLFDDLWHVQDRLLRLLPKSHSGFKAFAASFSQTLLVPDISDVEAVTDVYRKKGLTWSYALRANSDAVRRRVRRHQQDPSLVEALDPG